MVIIDVTVFCLGRFFVHDDLSTEEVLLHPWADDNDLKLVQETMRRKDSPDQTRKGLFLSSLSSLLDLDETDVKFHAVAEVPLVVEPDPGAPNLSPSQG